MRSGKMTYQALMGFEGLHVRPRFQSDSCDRDSDSDRVRGLRLPPQGSVTAPGIAALFALSGASGLMLEVVWSRMLGWLLGATTWAVMAVLVAFMGGLG